MPSNHHHILLYLPDCGEAETFLKQTIPQVLSAANNAYVELMTIFYPENFLRIETNKKSAASFISIRGREDEIPHESEDHKRTWLQIQQCVGVGKTQFNGSIRWLRESIVSFWTSARAWKFRCTFQRQHIVIHWSSSKKISAILRNWAQPDIGYWFGGNKCSIHVLRMYD